MLRSFFDAPESQASQPPGSIGDDPDRHLFQTEIDLRDSRFGYLSDHRITGVAWLPAAAFLEMVLEAAARL